MKFLDEMVIEAWHKERVDLIKERNDLGQEVERLRRAIEEIATEEYPHYLNAVCRMKDKARAALRNTPRGFSDE